MHGSSHEPFVARSMQRARFLDAARTRSHAAIGARSLLSMRRQSLVVRASSHCLGEYALMGSLEHPRTPGRLWRVPLSILRTILLRSGLVLLVLATGGFAAFRVFEPDVSSRLRSGEFWVRMGNSYSETGVWESPLRTGVTPDTELGLAEYVISIRPVKPWMAHLSISSRRRWISVWQRPPEGVLAELLYDLGIWRLSRLEFAGTFCPTGRKMHDLGIEWAQYIEVR